MFIDLEKTDSKFPSTHRSICIEGVPLLYGQALQSQDCLNHQHVRNSITSCLQDAEAEYKQSVDMNASVSKPITMSWLPTPPQPPPPNAGN